MDPNKPDSSMLLARLQLNQNEMVRCFQALHVAIEQSQHTLALLLDWTRKEGERVAQSYQDGFSIPQPRTIPPGAYRFGVSQYLTPPPDLYGSPGMCFSTVCQPPTREEKMRADLDSLFTLISQAAHLLRLEMGKLGVIV